MGSIKIQDEAPEEIRDIIYELGLMHGQSLFADDLKAIARRLDRGPIGEEIGEDGESWTNRSFSELPTIELPTRNEPCSVAFVNHVTGILYRYDTRHWAEYWRGMDLRSGEEILGDDDGRLYS